MTQVSGVVVDPWDPPREFLPSAIADPDVVVLLPTLRSPSQQQLLFDDDLVSVPKSARSAGHDVKFADVGPEPLFLSEFSSGPEVWEFLFAIMGPVTDLAIAGIDWVIHHRAVTRGWSREDVDHRPLDVKIAKMNQDGSVEGLHISGAGGDVIAALKTLKKVR